MRKNSQDWIDALVYAFSLNPEMLAKQARRRRLEARGTLRNPFELTPRERLVRWLLRQFRRLVK